MIPSEQYLENESQWRARNTSIVDKTRLFYYQ
jgi:hypothetical protein